MNARLTLKAIQQGQAQKTYALKAGAGQNGQALVIQAAKGTRYQFTDALTFTSPEKLQIKRVGSDLLIALPGNDVGSPDVVIQGYFGFEDMALTGLAPNGQPMVYDASGSLLSSLGSMAPAGITPASLQPDQTLSAGLAKGTQGWFDSGWGLGALAAGGLALAAASKSGGGTAPASTTNAGLAKIIAYNLTPTGPLPTVNDFVQAGVSGVDSSNLNGVLSALPRTQLPMTSAASIQSLVDSFKKVLSEANGNAADATPASDPSVKDYENLMGANTPSALSRKSASVELLNDRIKTLSPSEADTYSELKALADVVNTLSELAESNPSNNVTPATGLTADNLKALIGPDVTATSLSAVSDAIRHAPDDLSTLNTMAKLRALVEAYNKILAEANGSAADNTPAANPTTEDYAALHANIGTARTDALALERLNAIIGNLPTTSVDTVGEINQLAATLDKIQTVAALATGAVLTDAQKFSAEELKNLGLSGFTGTAGQNALLALKVSEAIRDSASSDVLKGAQTGWKLVDGIAQKVDQTQLERLQTLVSEQLIAGYSIDPLKDNASPYLAPTVADWQSIGVFRPLADGSNKFQALSSDDAAALNNAIDTLVDNNTGTTADDLLVNSGEKLRAIAASYLKILNEANGSSSNFASDGTTDLNTDPLWTDYVAIGITRKDGTTTESSQLTRLVNSVMGEKTFRQVDIVREIQNLVNVAEDVLNLAGGGTADLTLEKLSNNLTNPSSGQDGLGLAGVNTLNISRINAAIKAASDADVDTFPELQSLVSFTRIKLYADDLQTPPTFSDWSALKLSNGEDLANESASRLEAYKSAVDAFTSDDITGVGSSKTDTTKGSLQALVNSYNTILVEANGTTNDATPATDPSKSDYDNIGLGLDSLWNGYSYEENQSGAAALKLFNDSLKRLNSSAVDSITELSGLATTVKALVDQANNDNNATPHADPSVNPTATVTFSGTIPGNLGALLNNLGFANASKLDDTSYRSNGSQLNAYETQNVWASIQNLTVGTDLTYDAIQNIVNKYAF